MDIDIFYSIVQKKIKYGNKFHVQKFIKNVTLCKYYFLLLTGTGLMY